MTTVNADSQMQSELRDEQQIDSSTQAIPDSQKISAKDFAAKFSTKREVYHFLTFHCKAHLPPIRTVTSYFMRDLLSGKKKCKSKPQSISQVPIAADIQSDAVKLQAVPQYETLSIKKMFEKFGKDPDVANKLPVEEEIYKLPRDWVIGIFHTVKGKEFTNWVRRFVEERDKVYMEKKNQYIQIDPDIKQIFEKVKHTSGKWPQTLFL